MFEKCREKWSKKRRDERELPWGAEETREMDCQELKKPADREWTVRDLEWLVRGVEKEEKRWRIFVLFTH